MEIEMSWSGSKPEPGSILIVEWLCGGGMLVDRQQPRQMDSLLVQGRQMLTSVCADFRQAGWEIVVPVDDRITLAIDGQTTGVSDAREVYRQWVQWAEQVDALLLVAPESQKTLPICLDLLSRFPSKLLNPSVEFTRLCADKNRLQSYLLDHGIPVPLGCPVTGREPPSISVKSSAAGFVVKPALGCGGHGLQFIDSLQLGSLDVKSLETRFGPIRIEEFVPGIPVSVSVIRSSHDRKLLPPLRQQFDRNPVGNFVLCGNDLPLEIGEPASRLASTVVDSLPQSTGYFGIDMIIGNRDVVVEVNPRITMSYPVLREIVDFNMAELIAASSGSCESIAIRKTDRKPSV